MGLCFGESYRQQAAAKLTQVQAEERLLNQLQISVLETRIAQQDLSNICQQPKQVSDQHVDERKSKLLKQVKTLNQPFLQIKLVQSQTLSNLVLEPAKLKEWMQKYESVLDAYRQKIEAILLEVNTAKVELKTIQAVEMSLLDFNQSQVAIAFSNLAKDLTQLIEDSQQKQQELAIALEQIEKLQLQIITATTLLSVMIAALIATYTSRAIAYPLESATKVVRRVTEEEQFDPQVPARTEDKIEQLATSVNHGVQQVANDTQELQQTQTEFERFFNLSFDLFGIVGFDGYFKRLNKSFETTLGYTHAELVSIPFLDLVHPQERVVTVANVRKLLADVTVSRFENRYRCKDGSYKWLSWTVVPFAPEKLMYAVARDITERKQAELQLKQSERQQKALLNNIPDIAWLKDQESRFIAVNEAFGKLCGIKPEDFVGKTDLDILPADLAQSYRDDDQEVIRTGLCKCVEEPITDKAGKMKWIETIKTPIFNESGEVFGTVGIAREITERKQALESLLESKHFQEEIVQTTPNILYIYDLIEQRNIYSNRQIAETLGYTPEAITQGVAPKAITQEVAPKAIATMGANILPDLLHPDDLGASLEHLNRIATTEEDSFFELEYRMKDAQGEWHWFRSRETVFSRTADGKPKQILGSAEDITERKRVKEALIASQKRLQLALNAAQMGVWGWEIETGNVTYGERTEALFGLTPGSFDRNHEAFLNSVHPEDRDYVKKALADALEQETDYEIDYRTIWPDGTIHWLREIGDVLPDETGRTTAMAGTIIDITERQQKEEELRQSEARYRELANRETLLNRLASQIRNSLDLDTILETAVIEIRNLLQLDRCFFFWHRPDITLPHWEVVQEAKNPDLPSFINNCVPVTEIQTLMAKANNPEIKIITIGNTWNLHNPIERNFFLSLGYSAVLLIPIHTQSGEIGVICCTHTSKPRFWSDTEVEMLQAVGDQIAIAIDQAQLLQQSRLATDTAVEQATKLELTLSELQQAQTQLVQSEKMSSLGQLVAGIAHEINNPVSFIYCNVIPIKEYAEDLFSLIQLYQDSYPCPTPEIQAKLDTIDLDFIKEDLPKILSSMKTGSDRIHQIVLSLRNFSRLDEAEMKRVDIHEGLNNTLLILSHRLNSQHPGQPGIQVIKDYGNLPKVQCYPGQLNQVFMNILTNAIEAIEAYNKQRSLQDLKNRPGTILICTEVLDSNQAIILIGDNGLGMTEEVTRKLFDPFFTTKPIGSGTGLGMTISYKIVVEKHGGQLQCIAAPNQGTAILIQIPIEQKNKCDRTNPIP